jgi:hypothetical protein
MAADAIGGPIRLTNNRLARGAKGLFDVCPSLKFLPRKDRTLKNKLHEFIFYTQFESKGRFEFDPKTREIRVGATRFERAASCY